MNIKNKHLFLVPAMIVLAWVVLILFFSQHKAAAQDSPEQQAAKLQDHYSALVSLSFDFSQVTHTGGRERHGRGNALFFKPKNPHADTATEGKPSKSNSFMRWNYTDPDPQVIVSDGKTLSVYTKNDRQMIITSADELESDITYAFFSGTGNLLDDFQVLPPDDRFVYSAPEQLEVIRLVPRQPHNQIKTVQLWFDRNLLIHHLIIEDPFESVTALTFTNIRVNSPALNNERKIKKKFSFSPPPGTEIISR